MTAPGAELVVAARNLARTPFRSALSLAAIAAGVAAMMLAGGFIEWNLWYGRESTIHSQLGHLQIHRPGFLQSGYADPYRYLIPADDSALAQAAAAPHVVVVAPRFVFSGLASVGDTTISFFGEGLDPDKESSLASGVEIVSGERLAAKDPHGILVGEGLAANLGAKAGDRLVLVANTRTGAVNAVDVHVRGTFSTISKAYDDATIRLPLALANSLTRTSGAQTWSVLLRDTDDTATTLEALRASLSPGLFEIVPWTRLADFYNKVAALYARQFGIVKLIIAAVVVLGIANTLTMSVLERTSEIGTALALGRRRSAVLRAFLLEAALIGLVGGLAGAAIGATAAALISVAGIPMPPSPGMTHGFVAGIRLTPAIVGGSLAIIFASALVAGAYPAWRASRTNIVDAIRVGR
jgi:putative ABC transport system permease protein